MPLESSLLLNIQLFTFCVNTSLLFVLKAYTLANISSRI